MKFTFAMLLYLVTIVGLSQEIVQNIQPKVTSGSIQSFPNFKSDLVAARNIDVWLPNGYSNKEKYAVLYMHDGKALYDPELNTNKLAWEIDETVPKLISENKVKKFIVVGIWNNEELRHAEYFPEKIVPNIPEETRNLILEKHLKSKALGDNYLKFIVTELKPFIDKTFSTKTDMANTFMSGSSMGGIISLYGICEYPKVFGGVACLSTHFPLVNKTQMPADIDGDLASKYRDYLQANLPDPKTHKIYFDYGNRSVDMIYKIFQDKVDLIMKEKGYTQANWVTKFFDGETHSPASWKKRFDIPLVFLLGK
jgi:predicted alpha/beta superfamily hydrolase